MSTSLSSMDHHHLQACQEDMSNLVMSATSSSSSLVASDGSTSPSSQEEAPATATATTQQDAPADSGVAATTTTTTATAATSSSVKEAVVASSATAAVSDVEDNDDADDDGDDAKQKKQQQQDSDEQEPHSCSCYRSVDRAPPNAIFKLQDEYTQDEHENKSNLVLGVAVNDDGSLVYFDAVRSIEKEIYEDTQSGKISHGYPPIGGLAELSQYAAELVLGENHTFIRDHKVGGVQALSGTGSLRLVGEFLHQYHRQNSSVYLSDPTWANHKAIFTEAGFGGAIKSYRYYNRDTRGLDFDGLMEDLENANDGDIVVLHACAHNPTGVDPTLEQWTAIAALCQRKQLMPVFDCAYLGFASGDIDKDAEGMRHFANTGVEFFVCVSFSKNFGIYGQRCGSALFVSEDNEATANVVSQLKRLSRPMWSVPPLHGARIVTGVLGNPERKARWRKEVADLAERIKDIRQRLRAELEECTKDVAPKGYWDHITNQRGMFTFSGLRERQCEFLKTEHNIYMLPSGRINICGVSSSKLSRIASAIADAYCKEN
ncbi:glutamic-oxaloacetic transaminase 1 [Salpingoeca rosetta]|uniref:Glutamic-oxaloacetic transaminase 1 n=1 Tax=Salpingoeca rosetta (strain ATCC 50818 / BSB-021) TaxID=946362 RepID=F2ULD6_SALR5|nr:glutamic-oxaloacetic transaminase 1 [Salpingoeca rosetta]EGD77935.1 glutamic-oxaloacetic transaminase 1 [Salpingoeca rosetta]|eukprot:XP_004989998.1 glutamic-oxaloacetic transaminase 1 [Salpingoeca rosetta]